MAIVFKAPKSTLNTTSKQIQNVDGNCPPCPEPVLEGKELNYTQNGEYTVTPEQGVDGFSSIDVTVNVPSDVNNQDKTVSPSTSSQSVSADSGYTGLGTVTVNAVTSSIDANIQPENILSGVTILGVSGTDEGYDAGYTDGETAGHSAGYTEGEADGIVEGIAEQKAKLTTLNVSANGNYTREDGYDEVNVDVRPNLTTGNITSNGIYAPVGYDGFSSVDVNVQPIVEPKSVSYSANNTYEVTPNPGVDGLSRVTITVNVPSDINNQNKTVNPSTSSQSITADSGYSGLGTVTVNPVTASIDANIQAENILDGVTILGVIGTDLGYDAGEAAGYESGYSEGYSAGQAECPTPTFEQLDETITENGSYSYSPEADGFDSVDITVNVQPDLETKTATYVANNTYTITPTAGKDGISQATITVNVPSDVNNQNKTVSPSTSQQTVTADNGYSGLGTVTVNAVTAAIDANIVAENILDGVTILGVTGSDMGYDAGYADGYAQGQSECPEPGGCEHTAYVQETITTNGTYTYDPSDYQGESFDAFDGVEITVNVSGGEPNLQDKTVTPTTSQQTINADAGYDGLDTVTVNAVTSAIDQNIVAGNIKNGVTILGVIGTYSGGVTPVAPEPIKITAIDNLTVEYRWRNWGETKPIQYSKDNGETWTNLSNGSFNLDAGQDALLRGKNSNYQNYQLFTSARSGGSGRSNISGDMISLLDYENPENAIMSNNCFNQFFANALFVDASGLTLTDFTTSGCYAQLFSGNGRLVAGPQLPAKIASSNCYNNMFYGCTSLTVAPTLPAKMLGEFCYNGMFSGCTSLTAAPALPATFLADGCYYEMFLNCINLTTAPQLPATTMTSSCYCGMFTNCRKLTTAPILPATNLSGGYSCYSQMFAGCTGLTTAPELPAARLESTCYGAMFLGCTSLTASPVLPAAILVSECYNGMFTNCTNLAQVTCLATSTGSVTFEDCVYEWLDGTAATGTFYKDANMSSWPTNTTTGIPTGWTVSDYVPSA